MGLAAIQLQQEEKPAIRAQFMTVIAALYLLLLVAATVNAVVRISMMIDGIRKLLKIEEVDIAAVRMGKVSVANAQ